MRAASLPSFSSGFFGSIAGAVARIKTAWARRRLVGELAGFDDHLLRDIGLTRADVNAALLAPVLDDPTLELATRAHGWRAGQQAAAREREDWFRLIDDSRPIGSGPERKAA